MMQKLEPISWNDLAAELDDVMMPADQIAEYHRLWHASGADQARLASCIRADIEQRRPLAADITNRAGLLLRAIQGMSPDSFQGDAKTVVGKIKERAGLSELPRPPSPTRH